MKKPKKQYTNIRIRRDTYEGIMGMKADGESIDAHYRKLMGLPPRRYN